VQEAEAERKNGKSLVPLEPCGQLGCENQVSQDRGGAKRCESQETPPHNGWKAEDLGVRDLGEHRGWVSGDKLI